MNESKPSGTLVVVQSSDQPPDETDAESVVVIDDLLESVPVSEYDEVYRTLREGSIPDIAGIPLYDLLWTRFAVPFNGFPSNPMSLNDPIVLYRKLSDVVDTSDVSRIDCRDDVDVSYRAVVADFARHNEIETGFEVGAERHRVRGFLRGLLSLLVFVVDGVLSMILRRFFIDFDEPAPVVFVPHPNRFGSMRPVLDAADYEYRIVAPVSTIEWLYHRTRGRWSELAEYDPLPVGLYASPGIVLREVVVSVRLVVEVLIRRRFESELSSLVERRFGVKLDAAIAWSAGNAYPPNLRAVPNLWLSRRLYRTVDAERVVVGSLSSIQKAFLYAAEDAGLQSFHVPHTVPTQYDVVPKTDTTHFVPSQMEKEFHERESHLWTEDKMVVPLGRPLLASLAADRPEPVTTDEPIDVLIGTQPFDDEVRRTFVTAILDALRDADTRTEVVIKTHPVEDPAFYADIATDYRNVRVTGEDLHDNLRTADLTFVVASNVGAESVLLGTPSVSVNMWSPFIMSRPYITESPIPLLQSREELCEFAEGLSPDRIDALRDEEVAFFDEHYTLQDTPERIAEYIRHE